MLQKIDVKKVVVNSGIVARESDIITGKAREMEKLHTKYGHNATLQGEIACIKEWFSNKGNENGNTLANLLSKHPNWVPDKHYIVFPYEFTREIDKAIVYDFFNTIKYWFMDERRNKIHEFYNKLVEAYEDENWNLCWQSFVTEKAEEMLKYEYPKLKAKNGMKLSRLVNRFMTDIVKANEYTTTRSFYEHGEFIEKEAKPYNKLFAKFADAINPTKQTRWVIFSINPVDYATMSFGNSWASCHTIDTQNIRHSRGTHYHGMRCGGTLSYMLDGPSVVVYTVDGSYSGTDYEYEDKITRQMIHVNMNGGFLQSRLYPQACDGGKDMYEVYRAIEQEVLATCFNENNEWWYRKGTRGIYDFVETCEDSHHYEDYSCFSDVGVCVLKSKANSIDDFENKHEAIVVGHVGIGISNGNEIPGSEPYHGILTSEIICAGCGCLIDALYEEDLHEINGDYYCDDCCFWCEYCECYELAENGNEIHGNYGSYWLCNYGLEREINNGNVFICNDCGEAFSTYCDYGCDVDGNAYCEECVDRNWVYSDHENAIISADEAVWVESESDYRYEADCVQCEDCGEWFDVDDMVLRNRKWYCKNCAE